MAPTRDVRTPDSCPDWCVIRHGVARGAEAQVHVGGALLVRRTVLRLCTTVDGSAGTEGGPFVLLGSSEFTLHEAEALSLGAAGVLSKPISRQSLRQALEKYLGAW